MAYEVWSYIVDPGDRQIKVAHVFYGKTEAEAQTWRAHHIQSCEYFKAAVDEGREIQDVEQIPDDELPVADGGPILDAEVIDEDAD